MAGQKIKFMQAVQAVSTQLAQAADTTADLFSIYFDRGYNGGGADPLTDADMTGHDVTAAQVAAFITLAENLTKFLDNQTPFVSDYDATLNALRNDK